MKNFISTLENLCGTYVGEGINHEKQPFAGTLTFTKTFKGKGVALDFIAKGQDGTIYHKEHSLLGLTPNESLALWVMSDNHPSIIEHRLVGEPKTETEKQTLVFSVGDINNSNSFRETISLDLWKDGDVSYRYAWGMPGGTFEERSGVRMKSGTTSPVSEAKLIETEHGLTPEGKGWYVLNAKEARWWKNSKFGESCNFEGTEGFEQYGMNIHIIHPDQPSCHYHGEDDQEDFLVLKGQCRLLIEGQERILKPWDFVHCPKWARHVFVGYGTEPCVIMMVGGRTGKGVIYPSIPLAKKYNACPDVETSEPKESYAKTPKWEPSQLTVKDL